jgi:SP family general alpha glucoside:H+ symporter-like MFS transporter
MARMGRATIYMSCLALMLVCLLVIGGLGCVPGENKGASLAVGIVMVVQTLINMIGVGPVCYPIVAETPSGKLRYKTIVIGRVVYNITGIFNNTVTPRMLQDWNWAAKSAFFYAGTNLLCLIWCWFRLPETKDRSFGEIDLLFVRTCAERTDIQENKVPARQFKHTDIDQFAVLREAAPSVTEKKDVDEHAEYA